MKELSLENGRLRVYVIEDLIFLKAPIEDSVHGDPVEIIAELAVEIGKALSIVIKNNLFNKIKSYEGGEIVFSLSDKKEVSFRSLSNLSEESYVYMGLQEATKLAEFLITEGEKIIAWENEE